MTNIITLDQLALMSGAAPNDNMRSVESTINSYGRQFGIDRRHRLAQYLAQLMHEGGNFKYDREIWGPTPAQQRYDIREDLGNTPERDGDGELYAGRGPIQVTGGDNYRAFTRWARKNIDPNAPDFSVKPNAVNTDPWEGLSAIWYWSTHNLNALADENDIEQITKKINAGRNGLADRIEKYERAALVLAGFGPTDVREFQAAAQKRGLLPADEPGKPPQVDGDAGPKTRAALHLWLAGTGPMYQAPDVQAGPVVETKEVPVDVPVVPEGATKRGWNWLLGIPALLMTPVTWFLELDRGSQIIVGTIAGISVVLLLWRGELLVRRAKELLKEIGA